MTEGKTNYWLPKGERLIAEFREIESELNSELLEGLSDADTETFIKLRITYKSNQNN